MDGFNTEDKVIVFAATNRKDILDSALLRSGRFDRSIEMTLPDRKDRLDILNIYLNKVKLNDEKTIDEYSQRLSMLTAGFSGAEINNLVNEAAIISARENKNSIDTSSFELASDRVAGLETNRVLTEKQRKIIAYHEAGHVIAGWECENSNNIVKVSILPRSKGSLGFTQNIPGDITLYTKEQLLDMICVLLGGRVSEELFFNKSVTTGASDDLIKVSKIARKMILLYGMSNLGLISFNFNEDEVFKNPYSENYQKSIDMEANKIINSCLDKTRQILLSNKEKVETLASELLNKETLDLLELYELLGERKNGFSESVKEYIEEIKKRKSEEKSIEEFINNGDGENHKKEHLTLI